MKRIKKEDVKKFSLKNKSFFRHRLLMQEMTKLRVGDAIRVTQEDFQGYKTFYAPYSIIATIKKRIGNGRKFSCRALDDGVSWLILRTN